MPYVTYARRQALEPALNVLTSNLKPTIEDLEGAIEVLLTSLQPSADQADCLTTDSTWKDRPWYEVACLAATALTNMEMGVQVGDVNYMITSLILRTWFMHQPVSYTRINDIVGVLTSLRTGHSPIISPFDEAGIQVAGVLRCVDHEFMRRVHDVYEDGKILDNDDVFESWLGDKYKAPNQPLPYPNS